MERNQTNTNQQTTDRVVAAAGAPPATTLGIRVDETNPNHHLWFNNGTWYVHYTVYPTPFTAERIRSSLRTKDLAEARRRRDELFRNLVTAVSASAVPLGTCRQGTTHS